MVVYVLFFLILILGSGVLSKNKSSYLFIICFCFFCLIGLRSGNVGPDTPDYIADFYKYAAMNWDRITDEMKSSAMEPGYILLSWMASSLSNSYTVFLLFWAIFPAFAIYRVLKRYGGSTYDISISFIVLFILGLFAFFVAGIRQTAAMSILLFAYPYYKEMIITNIRHLFKDPNYWKFIVCLILAFYIHNSSLLILFAFPIKDFKIRWWYLLIALGCYYLSQTLQVDYIVQATRLLYQDRFDIYGNTYESELNMSGFYLQFILFLLCYLRRNQLIKANSDNIMLLNMAFIGLCFQSLTGLIGEFFRVSFFFSIYNIILIPRALRTFNGFAYRFISVSFMILALTYLFFLSSSHLPIYSFA